MTRCVLSDGSVGVISSRTFRFSSNVNVPGTFKHPLKSSSVSALISLEAELVGGILIKNSGILTLSSCNSSALLAFKASPILNAISALSANFLATPDNSISVFLISSSSFGAPPLCKNASFIKPFSTYWVPPVKLKMFVKVSLTCCFETFPPVILFKYFLTSLIWTMLELLPPRILQFICISLLSIVNIYIYII